MKAAVILTKCKNDHALFGIRTEQREDGGWYATWAFKVSEQTAARMPRCLFAAMDMPTPVPQTRMPSAVTPS